MSRLPIPHFIQRLFAEKADKPVIVTVKVDASGASMSAADQAKLTADMVMCWYTGDRSKLTSNLSITPAAGAATVAGRATSSTTFTIAFIHSANERGIASVISPYGYDVVRVPILSDFSINTSSLITFVKSGNIVTATIEYIRANNERTGWFTDTGAIPVGFRPAKGASIKLINGNKRLTPETQERIGIDFRSTGDIGYYNYLVSSDTINIYPMDTITYIAKDN